MARIEQLTQKLDCKEEEFHLPSFENFSDSVYEKLPLLKEDLERVYQSTKKHQVRVNALEALGWYSDEGSPLDLFHQALRDSDDRIKEKAAEVVAELKCDPSGEILDTLVSFLYSPSDNIKDAGVRALSLMGAQSVPYLIKALCDEEFQRHHASLDILVTLDWIIINDKHNQAMIDTILDGVFKAFQQNLDPSFFWKAGDTIGDHIGGEKAYRKLLRLVKDPRPEVRASACHGLGHTGMVKAIPVLLSYLEDDSPEVRVEAIVSLGELRSKKAAAKLIQALDDPDTRVQGSAAFALGLIGDPRAVKHLAARLNSEMNKEAAIALAYLGDSRSLDILLEILKHDSHRHPRYHQAIKALGFLGDKRAVDPMLKILTHEKEYPSSIIQDVLKALERMNFSIYD